MRLSSLSQGARAIASVTTFRSLPNPIHRTGRRPQRILCTAMSSPKRMKMNGSSWEHSVGPTYQVTGLQLTDHVLRVPLDHAGARRGRHSTRHHMPPAGAAAPRLPPAQLCCALLLLLLLLRCRQGAGHCGCVFSGAGAPQQEG
jgi:hypothetical protein